MRLIITYCLICIFLCGICSTDSFGQARSDFAEALQLFEKGQVREAYHMYEYIVFTSSSTAEKNEAIAGKAGCLKHMGEYAKAQKNLERIDYTVLSDSQIFHLRMQTALCAYLAGNFSDADYHLQLLGYFLDNDTFTLLALPLRIMILNGMRKYEDASLLMKDYIGMYKDNGGKDTLFLQSLSQLYGRKNLPKLKNPETAKLLSTFVPGLGQLYSGYFGEAAASAFFNLACLSVGGVAFYYRYFITGYLVGLGMFQKFYFGGQSRAGYLAEKRNYRECMEFNEKVKDQLLYLMKTE